MGKASWLTSLFKRNNPSKIDEILAEHDEEKAILNLNSYLWSKVGKTFDFSTLTKEEKFVLYILSLEAEIENGGFDQYFFNSASDDVYETLEALKEINANKTHELLQKAIQLFPAQPIPKRNMDRRAILANLSDEENAKISDQWNELDDAFYEKDERLSSLILVYAESHREKFK